MTVAKAISALGALLGAFIVAGCVTDEGQYHGGRRPVSEPDTRSSTPSLDTLNHRQRGALKEGCRDRYGEHTRKYEECVNGDRHSEDALVAGCSKQYPGDAERMRKCLGM
jgi:hypothetical protein